RFGSRALCDPRKTAVLGVRRLPGHERLEVHAGAEALAGAGEDPDTELCRVVELVHRRSDALRDGGVDRVALVRPVDRDQKDALAALGKDCWLIVHAANNFRSGSRSPRKTARSTSTHSIP